MEDSLPEAPLTGVTSPFEYFPRIASAYDIASIMFTVIFLLWAVYTVIAVYHWVRYGHQSWIAVPAIGIHLFLSLALMLFATSGFK